jgi:ribose transport system ATP-binding protein
MTLTDFLQMRKISKSYDGTHALRGVDFSADRGEVHAVVGENGAGKSTLIKILSGAVRRDVGEIWLDNQPVTLDNPFHARQLGIRAVYQEFSLIPHLTITENILIGQMPTGGLKWWVNWSRAHRQAQAILDEIGFRDFKVQTPVSRLSVPHQQMIEIAKALVEKPRVLILDEPSAVFSHEEIKSLFALIRRLKAQNTLILYISHRLEEVFEVADRITVLKDGQLVGTVRPHETDQNQLIKMMVGRTLDEIYPPQRPHQGEESLSVQHLSRTGAFTDVSFSLFSGEVLGLFGLVGSGRTEVARSIFGAEPPTSGEIYVKGSRFNPKNPRMAVGAGITYLTEDRKRDGLVMACSIRDNASLASLDDVSTWGILNRRQQTEVIRAKVRELNVRPPHIERLVRQLSGGNQQKIVFAKWLLVRANVLILDEPTRGVDVATKVEIYQIIRTLADQGIAVLLISSEMPEILGMSDRILVMREGRLAGELAREQATEENLLALAAVANPAP